MKKEPGRPPNSGNKTSLDPKHTSATESRRRLFYGHPEWKMIRLRELVKENQGRQAKRIRETHGKREPQSSDSRLPDDFLSARSTSKGQALKAQYLSARKVANDETARRTRYVLQDEIDVLWRDKVAEFERALLEGDYKWFERQAK